MDCAEEREESKMVGANILTKKKQMSKLLE